MFEASHKPFLKKEIYRFTLVRLSYLSRSLRSSLSFSASSCFALEIYSSSVFMLSSDRELKYFFLNRIKKLQFVTPAAELFMPNALLS